MIKMSRIIFALCGAVMSYQNGFGRNDFGRRRDDRRRGGETQKERIVPFVFLSTFCICNDSNCPAPNKKYIIWKLYSETGNIHDAPLDLIWFSWKTRDKRLIVDKF